MSKQPLKIMSDTFHVYRQLPTRGVFIDAHQGFVKVSPADYVTDYKVKGKTISKRRVYDAIVEAGLEARAKKLAKVYLPIGADTHKIKFRYEDTTTNTQKVIVLLDISDPLVKLDAFEKLAEEYKTRVFELGQLPFHNNTVSEALIQASRFQKHSRISSIFTRKRDGFPRIYFTMAFTETVFGIRPSTDIELFDDEDHSPQNRAVKDSAFDIDL